MLKINKHHVISGVKAYHKWDLCDLLCAKKGGDRQKEHHTAHEDRKRNHPDTGNETGRTTSSQLHRPPPWISPDIIAYNTWTVKSKAAKEGPEEPSARPSYF